MGKFPIGHGNELPSYVIRNKGLRTVHNRLGTGEIFNDNLCFFFFFFFDALPYKKKKQA